MTDRDAPPRPVARGPVLGFVAAALAAGAAAAALLLPRDAPPTAAPPAETTAVRFEEGAEAAGVRFRMQFLPSEQGDAFKINLYDHGAGVAIADVDGDGDDDLYFCNQLGRNALYRNDGGRRFTDVTATAGPVGLADAISVAAAFADVDGDGDRDLYVTTTRGGNVFLRNRGDGTFEDRTAEAGLTLVAHAQQPCFFDADRDGDLDLLVTCSAAWTGERIDATTRAHVGPSSLFELVASPVELNRYYRNRGDGTFEDATAAAGLAGVGWGGDTAVFDADEDGDLDVFVANMFGASLLFQNDGAGRFREVRRELLGRVPWGTVGARAFDADGDGHLDLFVADMHSDMWMKFDYDPRTHPEGTKFDGPMGPDPARARAAAGFPPILRADPADVIFGSALYRGLGGGRYEERSDRAGTDTLWPWGVAVGDFDADGDEDAFVPTGMGIVYRPWRSPLLVNRGDGTFFDGAAAAGLDPLPGGPMLPSPDRAKPWSKSLRAAAVADLDGDGRLDLVANPFHDRAYLWWNRSPAAPWVGFRLVGTTSDRDAIGATVRVRAGGRSWVRIVQAAGGYLSQSSTLVHVGLGAGAPARVDRVEVTWPRGAVSRVEGLETGRVHTLEEPGR